MTDFSASSSRTIIGVTRFHGRVRDGIGWFPRTKVARRKGVEARGSWHWHWHWRWRYAGCRCDAGMG